MEVWTLATFYFIVELLVFHDLVWPCIHDHLKWYVYGHDPSYFIGEFLCGLINYDYQLNHVRFTCPRVNCCSDIVHAFQLTYHYYNFTDNKNLPLNFFSTFQWYYLATHNPHFLVKSCSKLNLKYMTPYK
jgi:hypothetical protein